MMGRFRELDVKRLVVAALIVPLLLFSFFSLHTMPRFSQAGMEIVICTGTGVETLAVNDDEGPADRPAHSPCDWSMQIHVATLPAAGLTVDPVPLSRSQAVAFENTILHSGKVNSGRHARAPPLFL